MCRFQFFCLCQYISALKSFSTFFCSAYLSSCHLRASDAKYRTIRNDFSLQLLLRAWRIPHLLRSFQRSCDFFEFLSTGYAACLKPPVEIIIVKRLIQRHNNVTRIWVEPRSYDQSHRKNDGFITISASLSTLLNSRSPHSKLQQKRHGTISLYLMIELHNGLLRSRVSTSWWRHVIFQMFRGQCQ